MQLSISDNWRTRYNMWMINCGWPYPRGFRGYNASCVAEFISPYVVTKEVFKNCKSRSESTKPSRRVTYDSVEAETRRRFVFRSRVRTNYFASRTRPHKTGIWTLHAAHVCRRKQSAEIWIFTVDFLHEQNTGIVESDGKQRKKAATLANTLKRAERRQNFRKHLQKAQQIIALRATRRAAPSTSGYRQTFSYRSDSVMNKMVARGRIQIEMQNFAMNDERSMPSSPPI